MTFRDLLVNLPLSQHKCNTWSWHDYRAVFHYVLFHWHGLLANETKHNETLQYLHLGHIDPYVCNKQILF